MFLRFLCQVQELQGVLGPKAQQKLGFGMAAPEKRRVSCPAHQTQQWRRTSTWLVDLNLKTDIETK